MTAELTEATAGANHVEPTSSTERILAELLADVVGTDRVTVDGHFFDDLGADSLGMAQFCARVRRRDGLPEVSIKDVYRHPTIADLAAAMADSAESTPADPARPAPTEAGAGESPQVAPQPQSGAAPATGHLLCGALQLLAVLGYAYLAALLLIWGSGWISAGSGALDVYVRSVAFGGLGFLALSAFPIVAKWVLVGRWKPERIRVWSLAYLRFWIVKTLVRTNPLVLFAGSPLYVVYLRALGANIGRGAVILSRHVPVCTDLLTIGDAAVIRKDSYFTCYRAISGAIETGPVAIGAGACVGEATVLDIETSLGADAQLGHSSSLHSAQAVPDGERRIGSPAARSTEIDHRGVEPLRTRTARIVGYTVAQLVITLALLAPLGVGFATIVLAEIPALDSLLGSAPAFASWSFYLTALTASAILFLGALAVGLVAALTIPRLLNLAIQPNRAYPLYGLHWAAHRAITRLTNIGVFPRLFGDSSYIVHYLRWLGYDLSRVEQTGSNFGLEVKHETPFLASVGTGTMAADGLSIINADISSSSFRVSRATIGARNFVGNYVAYPSQSRVGENCLLATKVMAPVEGEVRENTGLLGSPSFEIPRSVERDGRFDHLKRGSELTRRLRRKNRHNAATIGLYLLSRLGYVLGILLLVLGAASFDGAAHALAIALGATLAVAFTVAYFALVERAATAFRVLEPRYCSIYQPYFWWHERYWKLSWQPQILDGTPFKALAWRLMGIRIGTRVFDDGCLVMDKTLVAIGDDCALNAGSVIQPHSQEDGTFKSDRIEIGAGCTLGTGALIHYAATMGDGSALGPDSFLIKGEELPAGARWAGNPAAPSAATERSRLAGVRGREQPVGGSRDSAEPYEAPARGSTAIPRWSLDPTPGVQELRVTAPDDLSSALRAVAATLDLPLESALLGAHAKVLAALSGEREVTTGYLVEPGLPVSCRISTGAGSWRALLGDARRAESSLLADPDFTAESARELGPGTPEFGVIFDQSGERPELAGGAALAVGASTRRGGLELRLGYRTDALDHDAASRIAGYHLAALRLIAADPEAEHARQSLLSAEELELQLEGLAGPRRELPDRRFHELFEERARKHPDVIAAVHAGCELTYGELNARANRIARALLARGLGPEAVVAVVSERNLDWMAAVIAIFKAGGTYLPIEPQFPAERIARTLARAACGLVLTEPAATTSLDRALESLSGVEALLFGDAFAEDRGDDDLDVAVAADQLAYIYFTSGSTGEPKGAMCEHAGMLNHLYAKIDDLRIAERPVVAQTAPQCFDISLWQLLSALLVGGRTVLIEQDLILDFERFLERIEAEAVAVLQVVPSYLDATLSELEREPRQLSNLRCVSVTGEAVAKDLVRRWFASRPEVELVNAYGLTETSDDTNHEVMDRAPEGERVPLGRPVANVHLYVVDEHLAPVPLGAPGEIVFSGICVGRGYVNDPERTRAAFLPDPHREGERLYRSGDRGRWRPDGKLEFLGRHDGQVKVSGFRIEIGEVESALARAPGVGQAAVVVAAGAGAAKRLVGFYSGPRPLETGALRSRLAESLPRYMVPSTLLWRRELPLTANGKVDRKALLALDAELGGAVGGATATARSRTSSGAPR
jgi:non-ribosomal peptide synthetase-like protein